MPLEDLELLERLEDDEDIAALRAAMAEEDQPRAKLDDVLRENGLDPDKVRAGAALLRLG